MKCTFCGGEVGADQLRCPYCNQENLIAYQRQKELNEETAKNEAEAKKVIASSKSDIVHKVLSRILIGLVIFFVIITIISFGVYMYIEGEIFQPKPPLNYIKTLDGFYETGDYDELFLFVQKYDIYDYENPKTYDYSQMALYYYDVLEYRRCFYGVVEYLRGESDSLSEYDWFYTFKNGYQVLLPDIGVYEEVSERNAKAFDLFIEEVILDWTVWFGVTREEIEALIADKEPYYYADDKLEAFAKVIEERLGVVVDGY